MRVIRCEQCSTDENLVYIGFDNGLGRLFRLDTIEETIKKESFYEDLDEHSKSTIALGLYCIRSFAK